MDACTWSCGVSCIPRLNQHPPTALSHFEYTTLLRSITDFVTLTTNVDFVDAVITRAPTSLTTSIHFKASFLPRRLLRSPLLPNHLPHACYNVSRDCNMNTPNHPNLVIFPGGLISQALRPNRRKATPLPHFINAHDYQQHSRS